MLHVLKYDDRFFLIQVVALLDAEHPDEQQYVAWCSDGVKELRDLPKQTHFNVVAGAPRATADEALSDAQAWIKTNWDAHRSRRPARAGEVGDGTYKVWLFHGDSSSEFNFREFADAKSFAKASEKCIELTKIGITNRESPEYLWVWNGEAGLTGAPRRL